MSGQSPLFRIAVTCAAIVIGSAVVGSQLATTGSLSRLASGVSDEEDDMVGEGGYAGPSQDPEHVEDRSGEDEARDEEVAEEPSEDAAEDGSEDAPEDAFAADDAEGSSEDEPGDLAEGETSDPAEDETGDSAEDESSTTSESESEDEGGIAVIRRKP